jgi:glucoamylase
VGTALSPISRVWFSISHGILDEIYYPRVDQACTRDMGLIVTDGQNYFSEEKRQADHQVSYLAEGVPAYCLTNTDQQGRYRIEKQILTDPRRDALLQQTLFVPVIGKLTDYHVYVLLAPHLGNQGANNTGWVGEYKGIPMLFAERDGYTLALACSAGWMHRSVGFVGFSDGWQDLSRHKKMTWFYSEARDGNIALTGEVNLSESQGEFTLALGFGRNDAEAGYRARASLEDGYGSAQEMYIRMWQGWQKNLFPLEEEEPSQHDLYRISTAVLRTHEASRFPGGIIASLSIPWGFSKGDDDLGGYHLVWPRDLVEAAGGLLAAKANRDVLRVLHYLQATQNEYGEWPQNMWLDGTRYWSGQQMDETAFPILLVDLAKRNQIFDQSEQARLWPMVRKAAGFLVRNGPVTQEDRWEEDPGYSPFTLAVEIAALLAAADFAEQFQEPQVAIYLRETADAWNASIERWIYVTGTQLAEQVGVDGYYVRIAPPDVAEAASLSGGYVPIKNRPPGESLEPAANIVSPDALALVRFGLRAPQDPRILNTLKVIDALLRVDTPCGPAWHRYNDDGYGEHADGSPFNGSGIGRAWPLLTGERAHYELAAGNVQGARDLMHSMEAFSNEGGMLPEQVWDTEDIPEKELFFGRPSGSAMPLAWAHGEYVKLRRSLAEGRVFDMPPQTVARYQIAHTGSPFALWRFNQKIQVISPGKKLRVEVLNQAVIHWSADNWKTVQDTPVKDTGLGIYLADLPVDDLLAGGQVVFTFYWPLANHWEGTNFQVKIAG